MMIKKVTQYITEDETAFDSEDDAKFYEKQKEFIDWYTPSKDNKLSISLICSSEGDMTISGDDLFRYLLEHREYLKNLFVEDTVTLEFGDVSKYRKSGMCK